MEDTPIFNEIKDILGIWFSNIEALVEHVDDIICYSDCDDMEDVARYYVEETGSLGEIPSNLQNYIDYQALGCDMDLEGSFLVTSHISLNTCRRV